MTKPEAKIEPGALDELRAARPDLRIVTEGPPGDHTPRVVPDYPWGTGPR